MRVCIGTYETHSDAVKARDLILSQRPHLSCQIRRMADGTFALVERR